MSTRVAELHRVVFDTVNPGHPLNRIQLEAEIELARAYARGRGIKRDVAFGCGLAHSALAATENMFQEDAQLRVRTLQVLDDVCADVADRSATERLTDCPVFGVKPQTLDAGNGARLTLKPSGLRLANSTGVYEDLWVAGCGEIIVSPRIVRAEAPPESRYVPSFLEFFLWRQMMLPDGTPTAGRRLEWKVMEILPWGLPQADGAVLRNYPGASSWPIRPVPRAITRGARLRLLPSGQVRWHFEGAPQFGTGTIGTLGGYPIPRGAQAFGPLRLRGRTTTRPNGFLQGVTVTLEGHGTKTTAITDANGLFLIETLITTPNDYIVTASLPGFETVRRRMQLTPEARVETDFVLPLGCVDVDLVVTRGLAGEVRNADLVAHLRIDSVSDAREWRGEYGCVIASEAEVSVLADTRDGTPRRLRLLIPSHSSFRYRMGDEVIAALDWDSMLERYTHWTPGARVINGVATLDDASVRQGFERDIPVDRLLIRLR